MPSAAEKPSKKVGDEMLVAAQQVYTKRVYPKDFSLLGPKADVLGHWVLAEAMDKSVEISVQLSKKDRAADDLGSFDISMVDPVVGAHSDVIHERLAEAFGDDYTEVLKNWTRDDTDWALENLNDCYKEERLELEAAAKE